MPSDAVETLIENYKQTQATHLTRLKELRAENERLRNDIAWQEKRNAMNVKKHSEEVERLRAIIREGDTLARKEVERLRAELKLAQAETDAAYHRETRLEARIEAALEDEIERLRACLREAVSIIARTAPGRFSWLGDARKLVGGDDAE
jgi:multidrug resistance efflux pump